MSTKSTICHGDKYHFYEELFDEHPHLRLEGDSTDFMVSPGCVEMQIPKEVMDEIATKWLERKNSQEHADHTNEELISSSTCSDFGLDRSVDFNALNYSPGLHPLYSKHCTRKERVDFKEDLQNLMVKPIKFSELETPGWYFHLDLEKRPNGLFGKPYGAYLYQLDESKQMRTDTGCADCGPFDDSDLFIGPVDLGEKTMTKLVAITQGAGELINKNAQEVIGYITRVSNPSNQMNFETVPKLLKYCIANRHWSPFEHAFMTVEIKTSRAIAAQILRHRRSFFFQEYSQRYSASEENIVYPARRQDLKNRQNSIDDMSEETKVWFEEAQKNLWNNSQSIYQEALQKGIAKEQARFLLPLNTSTCLYMSGNTRSWLHYIELRCDKATQKEHRDIADGCKAIFIEQFPDVARAMEWV